MAEPRWGLIFLGLLLSAALPAQEVWTIEKNQGRFRLTAEFSARNLPSGDLLRLRLHYSGPELPASFPELAQVKGSFTRGEGGSPSVAFREGLFHWERVYRLDPYRPGIYQTGRVLWPGADGLVIPEQTFGVEALSEPERQELLPVPESAWPARDTWASAAVWAFVLLGLPAAAAFGLIFFRRRPAARPLEALEAEDPGPRLEAWKASLHRLGPDEVRRLYRDLRSAWKRLRPDVGPELAEAFFFRPGLTLQGLRDRFDRRYGRIVFGGPQTEPHFEAWEEDLDAVLFFSRRGLLSLRPQPGAEAPAGEAVRV